MLKSFAASVVTGLTCITTGASALPPDPRLFEVPPAEAGKDDWFVSVYPEYRVRLIRVEPLEVNGTVATDVSWGEQRLRLDASLGRRGIGAVHMQVDVLDGVLFEGSGELDRVLVGGRDDGIGGRPHLLLVRRIEQQN